MALFKRGLPRDWLVVPAGPCFAVDCEAIRPTGAGRRSMSAYWPVPRLDGIDMNVDTRPGDGYRPREPEKGGEKGAESAVYDVPIDFPIDLDPSPPLPFPTSSFSPFPFSVALPKFGDARPCRIGRFHRLLSSLPRKAPKEGRRNDPLGSSRSRQGPGVPSRRFLVYPFSTGSWA